jgi:hypothetical protein
MEAAVKARAEKRLSSSRRQKDNHDCLSLHQTRQSQKLSPGK